MEKNSLSLEALKTAHEQKVSALQEEKAELKNKVNEVEKNPTSHLRNLNFRVFKSIYFDEKYLTRKQNQKIITILLLILVAVAEWPFNQTGLLPFRLSDTITAWFALFIGAMFALDAYFSAHLIKRGGIEKNNGKIFLGILLVVLAIIGAFMVAKSRDTYLTFKNHNDALGVTGWALLSIFIYLTGFSISYRFESDVQDLNLEKTFETELKKFVGIKKRIKKIDKEISSENDHYQRKLKLIELESELDEEKKQKKDEKKGSWWPFGKKGKKTEENPDEEIKNFKGESSDAEHKAQIAEFQKAENMEVK